MSVTFRHEDLPLPLTKAQGVNELGYSSIFSLPVSLLASTVFRQVAP